jgi:hypothetical protein
MVFRGVHEVKKPAGGVEQRMPLLAVFAVFAVFPGNLQRASCRFWQKSWTGDVSAKEKTAKFPLFRRCFRLFFMAICQERGSHIPASRRPSMSINEIRMPAAISQK